MKHLQKAKRAAGIKGQVATMLESHTSKTDTTDATTMKEPGKKLKKKTKRGQNRSAALGRPATSYKC